MRLREGKGGPMWSLVEDTSSKITSSAALHFRNFTVKCSTGGYFYPARPQKGWYPHRRPNVKHFSKVSTPKQAEH